MKTRNDLLAELHDIHKEIADTDRVKTAADWDAVAQKLRACLAFATKAKTAHARTESL